LDPDELLTVGTESAERVKVSTIGKRREGLRVGIEQD
jgi:hypothetical protein